MYFELDKEQHEKYDSIINAYDREINITMFGDMYYGDTLESATKRKPRSSEEIKADVDKATRLIEEKRELLRTIELEEFNKLERDPEVIAADCKKHFDYVYTTTLTSLPSLKLTYDEMKEEELIEASFKIELHLFLEWLEEFDNNNGTKYKKQLEKEMDKYLLSKDKNQYLEVVDSKYLLFGVDKVNKVLTTLQPVEMGEKYNKWIIQNKDNSTTTLTTSERVEPYQVLIQDMIGTIYYQANSNREKELPVKVPLTKLYALMNKNAGRMNDIQKDKLIETLTTLKRVDLDITTKKNKRSTPDESNPTVYEKKSNRVFGKSFVDIWFQEEEYFNGKRVTYVFINSLPPLFDYNQKAKHLVSVDRSKFYIDYNSTADNANYQQIYLYLISRARGGSSKQINISLDSFYTTLNKRKPEERANKESDNYKIYVRNIRRRDKQEFEEYLKQAKKNGVIANFGAYTKGDLAASTQAKPDYKHLRKDTLLGYRVTFTNDFFAEYHKSESKSQTKKAKK